MPSFIEYKVLAPSIPIERGGRARFVSYQLVKLKHFLLSLGFSRDDIVIVPSEHIDKVIDRDTHVVGIHVLDPQGLAHASYTLRVFIGGGKTCTQYEFEMFMERVKRLREIY